MIKKKGKDNRRKHDPKDVGTWLVRINKKRAAGLSVLNACKELSAEVSKEKGVPVRFDQALYYWYKRKAEGNPYKKSKKAGTSDLEKDLKGPFVLPVRPEDSVRPHPPGQIIAEPHSNGHTPNNHGPSNGNSNNHTDGHRPDVRVTVRDYVFEGSPEEVLRMVNQFKTNK